MAFLGLILGRAGEIVEGILASAIRTNEAAIVRQATRVLRSHAILFGSGVWFPPGVVVHLSAIDHERLSPMFITARGTVGAKVAARLRTPDGGVPEVRVIFDLDPRLPSGFAVSALERTDAPARLTVVKSAGKARNDASGYPCLVWPDGRRLAVDPAGIELGRDVVGPGKVSDPTVSARHAVVAFESGGVRITDVGSTNGTWVNGIRTGNALLHHGDAVRIGSNSLRLDYPAAVSTAILVEDATLRRDDVQAMWEELVSQVPKGVAGWGDTPENQLAGFRQQEEDMRIDTAPIPAQLAVVAWPDSVIDVLGFPPHDPYSELTGTQDECTSVVCRPSCPGGSAARG